VTFLFLLLYFKRKLDIFKSEKDFENDQPYFDVFLAGYKYFYL